MSIYIYTQYIMLHPICPPMISKLSTTVCWSEDSRTLKINQRKSRPIPYLRWPYPNWRRKNRTNPMLISIFVIPGLHPRKRHLSHSILIFPWSSHEKPPFLMVKPLFFMLKPPFSHHFPMEKPSFCGSPTQPPWRNPSSASQPILHLAIRTELGGCGAGQLGETLEVGKNARDGGSFSLEDLMVVNGGLRGLKLWF